MIDTIRAMLTQHPDYIKGAVAGLLCCGACVLIVMFCQFIMIAPARYRQGMKMEKNIDRL